MNEIQGPFPETSTRCCATDEPQEYVTSPFGSASVECSVKVVTRNGTELFASILGVAHVPRANYAVYPLTPELQCSNHLCFRNIFHLPI